MERSIDLGFTDRRLPVGAHICYLHGDEDADRYEIVRRFFDAGARAGEKGLYLVDTLTPDALRRRLGPVSRDLDVREASDPDGFGSRFSAEGTFAVLRAFSEAARREGAPSVRGSGEMSWALGDLEGTDAILEYEARLNGFLPQIAATAICQYDIRRFDGATMMDLLAVHPYVLARGRLMENPLFESPEAFLERRTRRRVPAHAG